MQKIQAIKRPSQRAQNNIFNLILNTKSLVSNELDWIRHGPDLAALGCDAERGWLNTFLEDTLNKISKSMTVASTPSATPFIVRLLVKQLESQAVATDDHLCELSTEQIEQILFRSHEQKVKTGTEKELRLLSADRLDIFLHIVLTIIATLLLLVPVFTLFRLQPTSRAEIYRKSNYQLLTVFIFTLVFSASCSIFTKARKQEVLTATAAYCAVLVVFLGNTSNVIVSQDIS